MTLFASMSNQGLEESQDRLGGFSALPSDIYTGKIKVAYAGKSAQGATSITLIVDLPDREYRETLYVTSRTGENFYTKDGKKYPLPGFTVIDDICLVTSGKPLCEQTTEEKVVKIYDSEAKKELPKSVPVLTDLTGLSVTLGILNEMSYQQEKNNDGVYVNKSDGSTRNQNVINKVFHTETKMTVAEARQGAEGAKFHDSWKERNAGTVVDKRKGDAGTGQNGAPQRPSANGAPTPSTGRKSLFPK